jgi:plasmid stabilization system protein ParE
MKVVYTDRFKLKLAEIFEVGLERFGPSTAERTFKRIITHVEEFLAEYPRTGRWRPEIACFYAWIPDTPFVVFYRLRGDTFEVLALFHHAQDTQKFDPD